MTWRRHIISVVTKPTSDHTLQTYGRGVVFNVETSSRTQAGDTTTLTSPPLTNLLGYATFEFWYSNSGSGTSFINFTASVEINSVSLPLFNKLVHGVVGWTHVCVSSRIWGTPHLKFTATALHRGLAGELAVDDIAIHPGNNCSGAVTSLPLTTPQTHSGSSVTCDFESSTMCGYKNLAASKDDFDWTRKRGSTISTSTGPTGDHTTRHGYYMYIETSSPRVKGDHAMLQSPAFSTSTTQHVTFYYSAYGSTIGSLKVYVKHGSTLGSPVFTDSTSYTSSVWHYACVNIPARYVTSHLVFDGVVGTSYHGDIAIDDVTLSTGSCGSHSVSTVNPTVHTYWGTWSSYGACSVTCGTGNVTRTRTCIHYTSGGVPCSGSSTQKMICHQPACRVDGHWSTWSTWSKCSVTCGRGTRSRIRSCTNPAPSYGGHSCVGSSRNTATCQYPDCPVNGGWGTWGAWSACSVTCGSGLRTSTRKCNSPSPSHGGHNCAGISEKQDGCQMTSCSVDGGWSDWTMWSKCSTSCELGTMSRDRSCSKPAPSGGGKQCTGGHSESHECSLGPCPIWSHWYQGDCSSTCGNGTAERMRSCSTGNNADCSGISYEHVPCIGTECIR
ncbi:hypothetical protein ACF0H5_024460 [Mactra antiquata]